MSIEFWTAWSAISTSAGAIATFWAVCVALRQLHLQNKKNLKVTLGNGVNSSTGERLFVIIISNQGNREVTLCRFSWKYKDGSTAYLLSTDYQIIADNKEISFPYKLALENSVKILYPIEKLRRSLQNAIKENLATKNDNIKVFVEDSLGDYYYTKTKLNVGELVTDFISIDN